MDPAVEPAEEVAPSIVSEPPLRSVVSDACVLTLCRRSGSAKIGLHLTKAAGADQPPVISSVENGSLAHAHSELKSGARILAISHASGSFTPPTAEEAAELFESSEGTLTLTVMPLLDRWGFIIDADADKQREGSSRLDTRRLNAQLRKWEKRIGSLGAWERYTAKKPEKLHLRIRQGVPDPVRGFVWKALAASRAPPNFRRDGLYQRLCEGPGLERVLPETLTQIDKDVPRTLTGHIFFRGGGKRGQQALARVLRAYAAYNPQLGYTQGMASYAAVLLLYLDEEDSFWVFAFLVEGCRLVGLFSDGFPLLHVYFDRWEELLRRRLPRLARHVQRELSTFLGMPASYRELKAQDDPSRYILPSVYVTPWFQAMLVGGDHPAPSALAPRIMDNLLITGNAGAIFSVGLAMLKRQQRALLKLRADALMLGLKQLPRTFGDTTRLMRHAIEMDINEVELGKPPDGMELPVGSFEL